MRIKSEPINIYPQIMITPMYETIENLHKARSLEIILNHLLKEQQFIAEKN